MKTLFTIIGILGSLNLAVAQEYVATINGSQEVPVYNGAPAVNGYADFTLSGSNLTCTAGYFEVSGTPVTATLNDGAPGTNGPVLYDFTLGSFDDPASYIQGSFSGSTTLTPQQVADLTNSFLYVNITTSSYPDGEIRGQVVPEPSTLALIGVSAIAFLGGIRRKQQTV